MVATKRVIYTALAAASLSAGCADQRAAPKPEAVAGPAGTAPNAAATPAPIAVEAAARDYASWPLMTPEPVFVSLKLAALCMPASDAQLADEQRRVGPHAHASIRVFMNESAAAAFRRAADAYPVGAVVVKEKSGLHAASGPDDRRLPDAVAGMIKREVGFNAANGDWEYFYAEEGEKMERGKIVSCVECHRGAKTTDFVFGGWKPSE